MANNQNGHATVAPCGGGLFGWLAGLFGSSTPTYAGGSQLAGARGWSLFGGTPTYQVAPPKPLPDPVQDASSDEPTSAPVEGEPVGTEILRPIAIIVRRESSSSGDGNGSGVAAS